MAPGEEGRYDNAPPAAAVPAKRRGKPRFRLAFTLNMQPHGGGDGSGDSGPTRHEVYAE